MSISERINIVPILAADITKDGSSIKNVFEKISFLRDFKGSFYIDFVTNAIIEKSYLIKYILVRRKDSGLEALSIDSFVIPPSEEFYQKREAIHSKRNQKWSIGRGNILSSHTIVKIGYDQINRSGEYGVVAFGKEMLNECNNDELEGMELLCEKHFDVEIFEN